MPPVNPYMEILSEEVMVDILSRLPVKTITHCKCVCKKWRNLVNDSYFINLHLSRAPAGFMAHHYANVLDDDTPGILKWVEIEDGLDHHSLHHDPVLNFDPNGYLAAPTPYTELIPICSVDGLICIWQRGVNVDNIHICNPVTREYLTLPNQQNYRDGHGIVVYKFGVNSLRREYKVLRIFLRDPLRYDIPARPIVFEAEVYTLGTSQWRSLGEVPYLLRGFRGPFLNGYFHCNVFHQDENICTFDLDKEKFQLFPSPPAGPKEWLENLGVFKGCLCKAYTYDSQYTIWVMKEYAVKASWHKELVITQAICAGGPDWQLLKDCMFVFGGLQDGTILVVAGNKLFAYWPKSKTIEDLAILSRQSILLNHRPSFIKLQDIDSERVHTF